MGGGGVVVLATGVGGNEWYLEGMRIFCYGTADLLHFRQWDVCVVVNALKTTPRNPFVLSPHCRVVILFPTIGVGCSLV